ncbi:MAG: TIGR00730 family Rossman fold protein [Gemmatimonadales bacterium]|nr:TIGR00730 family Rossman fold protein [Gemmatimonadales bacterium]
MATEQQPPVFNRICVFCGTNAGERPEYVAAARELGKLLADEGIELVYGGASVGIMGELADAAHEHGGHVTGIIPQQLMKKEAAHTGIPDLIVVASMHQRKSQMADLSDGFIALPGGIGTLEGYFEILTWGQLGIHRKPSGILNVAGYFDRLIEFLDHAVKEGFLEQEHREMIVVESDARKLLERLKQYAPGDGERLMGRTHR